MTVSQLSRPLSSKRTTTSVKFTDPTRDIARVLGKGGAGLGTEKGPTLCFHSPQHESDSKAHLSNFPTLGLQVPSTPTLSQVRLHPSPFSKVEIPAHTLSESQQPAEFACGSPIPTVIHLPNSARDDQGLRSTRRARGCWCAFFQALSSQSSKTVSRGQGFHPTRVWRAPAGAS